MGIVNWRTEKERGRRGEGEGKELGAKNQR